jgi:hypothetical protein
MDSYPAGPGSASQLVNSPEYQEVSAAVIARQSIVATMADFQSEEGTIQ